MSNTPTHTRYAASFTKLGDAVTRVVERLRHLPDVAGNNTQESQREVSDYEVEHDIPHDVHLPLAPTADGELCAPDCVSTGAQGASRRTAAIRLRERQALRDAADRLEQDPTTIDCSPEPRAPAGQAAAVNRRVLVGLLVIRRPGSKRIERWEI